MSNLPGKVAVITGDPSLPDPTKHEQRYGPEDLKNHEKLRDALAATDGFDYEVIERHEGLFDTIAALAPDLVVNFCDTGLYNNPEFEIHAVTGLELLGLPYTGASPRGILVCYDKQIVRLVAEAMGVAVPAETFVPADRVRKASPPAFPALIKPNTADGSVGITKNAIVGNAAEAREYMDWLAETLPGKDVLIQEYLPGPEYGLGLIGNTASGLAPLPMLEVDFSGLPEGCAPILSFEAKTDPDSPWWNDIAIVPAGLATERQREIASRCEALFRRLSLRDYGRFDFRAAADGSLRLMEVNPNPAWGYDAKLALMAGFAGWSYSELLVTLIRTAWQRVKGDGAAR